MTSSLFPYEISVGCVNSVFTLLGYVGVSIRSFSAGRRGLGGFIGPGDVLEEHLGMSQRIVPACYKPGSEPPAADFTLVDQFNRAVTLGELWGRPVVITFSYTY